MSNKSVLFDKSTGKNLPLAARMRKSNISMIKEMMYLAEIEKRKGKNIVSLGVGVPHFRMPKYIRNEISKLLIEKNDIDKYTFFAGMPNLRKLIAEKVTKELKIKTSENNILVTPGSMAGLFYSILTIIDKGDEVILLSPYFASYAQQVYLAEGKIIEVPLKESKSGNFSIDLERVKKSITGKTKAIIVNSPHNPTGAVFSKNELKKLADIIHKAGIYLITDEVYDYLVYDNKPYFNIATIKKLWPKVIRCCSLSKKYNMTGWRIGFIHTNEELLKFILKVHDNAIVCAPHISQEAALVALSYDSEETRQNKQSLEKNRNLICERLNRLPDLFSCAIPRGAYYVFPKYKLKMRSTDFALKLLYEAGVIVTPGIGFGKAGEGRVRMLFGCTVNEINEAFDRIEKWWEKAKRNLIKKAQNKVVNWVI